MSGPEDVLATKGAQAAKPKDAAVKKPEEYKFSFQGSLIKIGNQEEIKKALIAAAVDAKIPESMRQEVFDMILSNRFLVNLKKPASQKEKYLVVVFANMLRYMGDSFKLKDPTSYDESVNILKKYKRELILQGRVKFDDDDQKERFLQSSLFSSEFQSLFLDSIGNKITSFKTLASADVPQKAPSVLMKYLLKKLGFDVKGVEIKQGVIWVSDPSLSAQDIENMIKVFKGSAYQVQFVVPGSDETLKVKINNLREVLIKQNAPKDEIEAIDALLSEIDRSKKARKTEDVGNKDVGLSEAHFLKLQQIYKRLLIANKNSEETNTLTVALNTLKKMPGLSRSDAEKLEKLGKIMAEKKIKYVIGGDTPPELKEASEGITVLNRLAQELATISSASERSLKDATLLDIIKRQAGKSFTQTIKDAMTTQEVKPMTQALYTGTPPGHIPVIKFHLFKDKMKRMNYLSEILFGKDGKPGLIGDNSSMEEFKRITDEMKAIETEAQTSGGFSSDHPKVKRYGELAKTAEALRGKIIKTEGESMRLYEEYMQLVGYMTSDEIDYEFLRKFRDVYGLRQYGNLLDKEVEVTDPRRMTIIKVKLRELVYGDEDNSILNKFYGGDKWTSLDTYPGEGRPEERIVVAKQALKAAIMNLNLTKEDVSVVGLLTYLVGSKIPLARIKYPLQALGIGSPIIGGNSRLGANDYQATKVQSLLQEKYPELLRFIQNTGGSRANQDFGLNIKMLLIQNTRDSARYMGLTFGSDSVKNMNNIGAADLVELRAYSRGQYLIAIGMNRNIKKENVDKVIEESKKAKLAFPIIPENSQILTQIEKLRDLMYKYEIDIDPKEDLTGESVLKKIRGQVKNINDYNEIVKGLGILEKFLQENTVLTKIDRLRETLNKYDIKLDLQDENMDPNVISTLIKGKNINDVDLAIITEGLGVLRRLLTDHYALMGATAKATEKKQKGGSTDPVTNILLGEEGRDVQFRIKDAPKGFWALPTERADLGKISLKLVLSEGVQVLYKTPKQSLYFKLIVPLEIGAGFYQVGSFGKDAAVYKWQSFWASEPKEVERYKELANMSFAQAADRFFGTAASFFLFEHHPLYPGVAGRDEIVLKGDKPGGLSTGIADLAVNVPFGYHALKRVYTLVTYPLKKILGIKTMPFDAFMRTQGMTVRATVGLVRLTGKIISSPFRLAKYVFNRATGREATYAGLIKKIGQGIINFRPVRWIRESRVGRLISRGAEGVKSANVSIQGSKFGQKVGKADKFITSKDPVAQHNEAAAKRAALKAEPGARPGVKGALYREVFGKNEKISVPKKAGKAALYAWKNYFNTDWVTHGIEAGKRFVANRSIVGRARNFFNNIGSRDLREARASVLNDPKPRLLGKSMTPTGSTIESYRLSNGNEVQLEIRKTNGVTEVVSSEGRRAEFGKAKAPATPTAAAGERARAAAAAEEAAAGAHGLPRGTVLDSHARPYPRVIPGSQGGVSGGPNVSSGGTGPIVQGPNGSGGDVPRMSASSSAGAPQSQTVTRGGAQVTYSNRPAPATAASQRGTATGERPTATAAASNQPTQYSQRSQSSAPKKGEGGYRAAPQPAVPQPVAPRIDKLLEAKKGYVQNVLRNILEDPEAVITSLTKRGKHGYFCKAVVNGQPTEFTIAEIGTKMRLRSSEVVFDVDTKVMTPSAAEKAAKAKAVSRPTRVFRSPADIEAHTAKLKKQGMADEQILDDALKMTEQTAAKGTVNKQSILKRVGGKGGGILGAATALYIMHMIETAPDAEKGRLIAQTAAGTALSIPAAIGGAKLGAKIGMKLPGLYGKAIGTVAGAIVFGFISGFLGEEAAGQLIDRNPSIKGFVDQHGRTIAAGLSMSDPVFWAGKAIDYYTDIARSETIVAGLAKYGIDGWNQMQDKEIDKIKTQIHDLELKAKKSTNDKEVRKIYGEINDLNAKIQELDFIMKVPMTNADTWNFWSNRTYKWRVRDIMGNDITEKLLKKYGPLSKGTGLVG